MNYKKIYDEATLLQETENYKRLMLYGSGAVGKKIQQILCQNEIEIDGFIVTHNTGTTEVNHLTVYEVAEIPAKYKDTLVIISTKEALHQEILKETERYGMNHVICITDELYAKIKGKIKAPREKLFFQVHITEHCNLNCRGCYHFSPLAKEEYLSIEEYTKDIKRLSELFEGEMEQIMLLGGEPLLHPQMAEFVLVTRKYFPKGKIKILSNGILVPKMGKDFWDACMDTDTELWLTKYPISVDYDEIEKIAGQYGKTVRYFSNEPVRTLGHQPLDITGKRDYRENFASCYRANDCILLDHGKMYTCLIAAESKHFSRYFNLDLDICEQDYVDIYSVESGKELLDRLITPTPFCRFCNRDDVAVFGRIPWQRTQKDIREWTE